MHNLMNLAKKSTACRWVSLLSWCILTLTIILPLSATIGLAQRVKKNSAQDSLQVIAVVYLTDIFELNLNTNSYSVRFILVFIHNSEDVNILRSFWINNARSFKVTDVKKNKIRGRYYESATVTAEIVQDYDITKFPFDHQVLTINIFGQEKKMNLRQVSFLQTLKPAKLTATFR
jgi:hypothetical protein